MSDNIQVEDILGSWALSDFVIESKALESREWNQGAHGLLVYTPQMRMSVSINSDPTRENYMDSILFYSGKFELKNGFLYHIVENASEYSRIGTTQEREFELKGNKLKIIGRGDFGAAKLLWERI